MVKQNAASSDRKPPQASEAEAAVIGSMLLEKEAIPRAIEVVTDDAFYEGANHKIFKCIVDMFMENQAVDVVTLKNELKKRKELEDIGGAAYLSKLLDSVATAAHVEYYAKIVLEKYVLRSLISSSTQIIADAYDDSVKTEEILDKAEQRIFQISESRLIGGFLPLKGILKGTFEEIEKFQESDSSITGLATGYHELDQRLAGLQKSDMIIVAGRPSMGKTSFCLNIAHNVSVDRKIPVGIFSLEMSKEQLVQRMLCSAGSISSYKLRTQKLNKSDWGSLTIAAGKLNEAPVFIDDTPSINVLDIRAKCRRLKAEHDVKLVFIDYLQLVQVPFNIESRQQEISYISRSLKTMAKELNMPVVVLSQLSRAVESRQNRRPQLSDLRESGAIEQDADVVMFIYRDEVYDEKTPRPGVAEIIIGKQRNGPTGLVELSFAKDFTRFGALEQHRREDDNFEEAF
ncbi:replicative DNA helicase [candidate division KSB1 bacterium]